MNYIVTKRPGEPAQLVEHPDKGVSFETLKNGVGGGYFEVVPFPADRAIDIWCDEEGALKRLPFNFWHPVMGQPIVGHVIACAHDGDGDSIPISRFRALAIKNWLDNCARV